MIRKLTETVFVQESPAETRLDAADWTLFDGPLLARRRFVHVVNFYNATGSVRRIQKLTADTMRRAASSVSRVRLIAVVSRGESGAIPLSFEPAPELQRTVADIRRFALPRPLPLLFDILANGAAAAMSDSYIVFTNSDICVVPHFYSAVRCLIERDIDCLIVNRRTVAAVETYGTAPELAAVEIGSAHPGLDCFVFPAAWIRDFVVSDACVGAGWVMRSLLYNLVVHARRMLILRDAHMTYHYGDDQPWNAPDFREYFEHNLLEARAVLEALSTDPVRRKALSEFCVAHGEPLRPK